MDNNTCEYYTGLTEGAFKYRLYGHNSSFKSNKQKNSTKLSKHIWWLKSNNMLINWNGRYWGKPKATILSQEFVDCVYTRGLDGVVQLIKALNYFPTVSLLEYYMKYSYKNPN